MWTVNSSGAPPTQLTTASSCKDILCYCVFEVVVQCPGFEKKVCLVKWVVRLDGSAPTALEQELKYGSPFLFIESAIALNQALIL